MKRIVIVVCFSGGRTSAFMCWWLKTYMGHLYDFVFVYANTGLEHEKTLEFVDKCDKYFNLNLIWVEAVINKEHGKGTDYTIVDYKSACRDNRLFKEMCEVYGLMNGEFIHCTRELKNQPIKKFAQDYIGKDYRIALGIRHDEFHRVKNRKDAIYPLATIGKITKEEILNWWNEQPFDLEIEEHYGNCVGCYKKSDKKLKMIADENPHYFDAFIELENMYRYVKSESENKPRVIYRHFRTAYEVKHNLKFPVISEFKADANLVPEYNVKPFSLYHIPSVLNDECSEECGSVISDYESTPIIMPEKTLLDFI